MTVVTACKARSGCLHVVIAASGRIWLPLVVVTASKARSGLPHVVVTAPGQIWQPRRSTEDRSGRSDAGGRGVEEERGEAAPNPRNTWPARGGARRRFSSP
ncbi:hypothetical protein PR202_ga11698 [Eleusine coracana subsp. coracana]|uniref:Uncharacterized protein n=1 Tax=Eleusine coracana subsp. coracana TaxID=191504 RepID=A0AAV5C9P8_ELECO|nr:hypothetical protein PR202_ga11698 [Eleusine coracana subsp. coracana]